MCPMQTESGKSLPFYISNVLANIIVVSTSSTQTHEFFGTPIDSYLLSMSLFGKYRKACWYNRHKVQMNAL